jgi:hypothetical protein
MPFAASQSSSEEDERMSSFRSSKSSSDVDVEGCGSFWGDVVACTARDGTKDSALVADVAPTPKAIYKQNVTRHKHKTSV